MCAYCFFTGRSAYMLTLVSFIGEITNPLINLAEVLEYRGVNQKYITPLQFAFLISFILLRMIYGRQAVSEIQMSNCDFLFILPPTYIMYQSYDWTWMMLNKLGKLAHEVSISLLVSQSNFIQTLPSNKSILAYYNFLKFMRPYTLVIKVFSAIMATHVWIRYSMGWL